MRDEIGEKCPCLQEIHPVSQNLVNALRLEGAAAAPDVQVERRSTTGTGSRIVELKAMGLRTHVEYTSRTNKLKNDEKESQGYTNNEDSHRHLLLVLVV
jgi:hypothetical protein